MSPPRQAPKALAWLTGCLLGSVGLQQAGRGDGQLPGMCAKLWLGWPHSSETVTTGEGAACWRRELSLAVGETWDGTSWAQRQHQLHQVHQVHGVSEAPREVPNHPAIELPPRMGTVGAQGANSTLVPSPPCQAWTCTLCGHGLISPPSQTPNPP